MSPLSEVPTRKEQDSLGRGPPGPTTSKRSPYFWPKIIRSPTTWGAGMGAQRAGASAHTLVHLGTAESRRSAPTCRALQVLMDPTPNPRVLALCTCCATFRKLPNLSGPRPSRSLVKARRRPGCEDPTRPTGPGSPLTSRSGCARTSSAADRGRRTRRPSTSSGIA